MTPWFTFIVFAKEEIVFARTSPKHKLEIVKRAQALGHIVGVTGVCTLLSSCPPYLSYNDLFAGWCQRLTCPQKSRSRYRHEYIRLRRVKGSCEHDSSRR